MHALMFVVAVAMAIPHQDKAALQDAKSVQDQLQGEWTVDKVERNGKEAPKEKIEDYRFIFKGTALTLIEPKKRFSNGSYSLDARKSPVQIDIKLDHKSGEKIVLEGIVEIQGDQAKLCYMQRGPRPTEFAAPEGNSDQRLFFLKRAKK
jgi:uncharacterized protein (TIGR03067 family)